MTVDIKLFAPVARATNSIYMYVIDATDEKSPAKDDTYATIKEEGYFNNDQLIGSVKKGDIVFVNASDGFGILLIDAVDIAKKTITTKEATIGVGGA